MSRVTLTRRHNGRYYLGLDTPAAVALVAIFEAADADGGYSFRPPPAVTTEQILQSIAGIRAAIRKLNTQLRS